MPPPNCTAVDADLNALGGDASVSVGVREDEEELLTGRRPFALLLWKKSACDAALVRTMLIRMREHADDGARSTSE